MGPASYFRHCGADNSCYRGSENPPAKVSTFWILPLALTWTSAPGPTPHHDCSGTINTEGRRYWFEAITWSKGIDVSLWALSSRGQVRRSREVKIRRDAYQEIRKAIVAAYRQRFGSLHKMQTFSGGEPAAKFCTM